MLRKNRFVDVEQPLVGDGIKNAMAAGSERDEEENKVPERSDRLPYQSGWRRIRNNREPQRQA